MIIKMPDYVNKIILQLYKSGFDAYAVGGAVRDSVMGRTVNDWDVTTNATAVQIKDSLKEYKIIDTGIKHGTVTVISDGNPIEVTTYRIDGEYKDNRHPQSVEFTKDLAEDLKRRDFTVNAMAYNNEKGLIDLFGGKTDIKAGIIKCVGDPDKRFNEDALRIMRALRFASVLGFDIENNTSESILKNKSLIKNVSAERFVKEFSQLLCGKNVCTVLKNYSEVITEILPELKTSFEKDLRYLDNLKSKCEHRLSALIINSGADAYTICRKLKLSNKSTEEICYFSSYGYDILKNASETQLKLMAGSKSEEFIMEFAEFNGSMFGNGNTYKYFAGIYKSCGCLNISQLKVNGNDLLHEGISGKNISEALNKLLLMVLEGKLKNNKTDLLNAVREKNYD